MFLPKAKMFKSFMNIAIEEAKVAQKNGEIPVGAVVIDSQKKIISRGRNMTRELNDPTAHAEIIALRNACNLVSSNRLIGCSLYVTLEPCPMCASAISAANIENLFYGASDPKSGGIENGPRVFTHKQIHFKTNIFHGFYEAEISDLLTDFFQSLRKFKGLK